MVADDESKREIAELKLALARAEAALANSEERYRQAFETNRAVKIIVDPGDGSIVDANRAAVEFYGYPKDELLQLRIHDINTMSQERVEQEMRNAQSERRLYFRFVHRLADGSLREVDVYSGPINYGDRRRLHSIVVDVTARRQLEEQLARTQKMESVARLAGGVAHDFNNLLTAILGHVTLARARLDKEHSAMPSLSAIELAAERAAGVTRQMLTLSRAERSLPRPVRANGLLLEADRLLRRLVGEGIEMVTLPCPSDPWIEVDPGQLQQVLVNLVLNARDAMPEGGRLTLEAKLGEPLSQGDELSRRVLYSVSDTGEGMSADIQSKAFEPFFTTKHDRNGTGLGLPMVQDIVEKSGGKVMLQSQPGAGTSVELDLPQVPPGEYEPESATESINWRESGTILVVEDEFSIRQLYVSALEERGYRVLVAGNGLEASQVAKKANGPVDLLLTDVVMPLMNGPQLARRMRARHPGIAVLYVSGYAPDLPSDEAAQADLLAKPFSPATLANKVRSLLAKRQAKIANKPAVDLVVAQTRGRRAMQLGLGVRLAQTRAFTAR